MLSTTPLRMAACGERLTSWRVVASTVVVTAGVVLAGQFISRLNWIAHELGKPPLFDIIHRNLPDLAAYAFMNWIFLTMPMARFFWLRQDVQLYTFLVCAALSLRAITISVTSQPSCTCFGDDLGTILSGCSDYWYHPMRIHRASVYLTARGARGVWNSFSGHVVVISLSAFRIIRDRGPRLIEKILWALFIPTTACFISASRTHYTVDVILAVAIAFLLDRMVVFRLQRQIAAAASPQRTFITTTSISHV
jgi:hypothetical protein